MPEQEGLLFVGVKEPVELRRTLLESTKEVIECLQKFEKFKSLRGEKLRQIEQLKNDVKEINKLVAKLKSELPKVSLKLEEEKPKADKKVKGIKKEIKVKKKKELDELEKLESELDLIEEKLGGMK